MRVQGSGFRVQGPGFRVQGSVFRVQGIGFRVEGSSRAGTPPPCENESQGEVELSHEVINANSIKWTFSSFCMAKGPSIR